MKEICRRARFLIVGVEATDRRAEGWNDARSSELELETSARTPVCIDTDADGCTQQYLWKQTH